MSSPENDPSISIEEPDNDANPSRIVREYLAARVPVFDRLAKLRDEGWSNTEADSFFKNQQDQADNANRETQVHFFKMMLNIAAQLDHQTSALTLGQDTPHRTPAVLDICMAPGGFTKAVLQRNPRVRARGLSLPAAAGGHEVLLSRWERDARLALCFLDITMLAAEMGVTAAPAGHPAAGSLLSDRPFVGEAFDLVFCDGQVLRTHRRAAWRAGRGREAGRLTAAQLVLALQRVRAGGTLVVLMHKADAWRSVELLRDAHGFAAGGLALFKPAPMHAKKSSFYLVARGVQPDGEAARAAVARWKRDWYVATFGSDDEYRRHRATTREAVEAVLDDFGPELCRLGGPVWEIQEKALRKAVQSGWRSRAQQQPAEGGGS